VICTELLDLRIYPTAHILKRVWVTDLNIKMESFGEQLKQSEESFMDQFDPNSDKYHNGSPEPVPIGGKRVPESMPTEYPENMSSFANAVPAEEYGEEYTKADKNRKELLSLKKLIASQTQIVEAIYRHEQHFKEKADKTSPVHIAKHQANLAKENGQLDLVNTQLASAAEHGITSEEAMKDFVLSIQKLILDSKVNYETKE
jgi:hypothetical protein